MTYKISSIFLSCLLLCLILTCVSGLIQHQQLRCHMQTKMDCRHLLCQNPCAVNRLANIPQNVVFIFCISQVTGYLQQLLLFDMSMFLVFCFVLPQKQQERQQWEQSAMKEVESGVMASLQQRAARPSNGVRQKWEYTMSVEEKQYLSQVHIMCGC